MSAELKPHPFIIEKLNESTSFEILKTCAGCVDYIRICKQVLLERGIDENFVVKFLKTWNGRTEKTNER